MNTVAQSRSYVVGVDTHARTHTLAVVRASTGELLGSEQFPASSAGMRRSIQWAGRLTGGDLDTLWAIEGTGSYGAIFTGLVVAEGYQAVEAPSGYVRHRSARGKTDPQDAAAIAVATLAIDERQLRTPRSDDGVRAALRVLVAARELLTTDRTANVNALTALVRSVDLNFDARRRLVAAQIREVAKWRVRDEELAVGIARAEAVRMAKRISSIDAELKDNLAQITELIQASPASPLLQERGIGPLTVAIAYAAWSHPGRIRSEAAFAALAGVSPVAASSGNTVRHRLNRRGDRRLNRALHMATVTKMIHDPVTREYIERRLADGKTTREIRRCLKRYLARHIYRSLNALHATASVTN